MCVGKNSAQAANVRRSIFGCAVRCSGLYPLEKMLAFLREAVDFVDGLGPGPQGPGFFSLSVDKPGGLWYDNTCV